MSPEQANPHINLSGYMIYFLKGLLNKWGNMNYLVNLLAKLAVLGENESRSLPHAVHDTF